MRLSGYKTISNPGFILSNQPRRTHPPDQASHQLQWQRKRGHWKKTEGRHEMTTRNIEFHNGFCWLIEHTIWCLGRQEQPYTCISQVWVMKFQWSPTLSSYLTPDNQRPPTWRGVVCDQAKRKKSSIVSIFFSNQLCYQ